MATISTAVLPQSDRFHMLSVSRLFAAGGITAGVVFVLCWLGTFIPFSSPTHAYISLFTRAEVSSIQALGEGTLWSLLFGALVGALFALVYNAVSPLGRR